MYSPKVKIYSVEIIGTVEVVANFTVSARDEDSAIEIAEKLFQDYTVASNQKAESYSVDCTVVTTDCADCHEEQH